MHDAAGTPGGRLVAANSQPEPRPQNEVVPQNRSAVEDEGAPEDGGRELWFADRATRLAAARAALRTAESRRRSDPVHALEVRSPRSTYDPTAGDGGAGQVPAPVPYGLHRDADGSPPDPLRSERSRDIRETAPLADLEYAVVDVETTGGSGAFGHRVTEVGVVCLTGRGRFLGEIRTLVNPHRPIPAAVRRLTRISQEMVDAAPDFANVAETLQAVLRGRVLVAHNAGFDWRFLHGEFALCRRRLRASARLCTVRMGRRLVPEVRSRSLDSLTRYFGIPNEARHRAWGDARATAALLVRLVERAEERAAPTLADLRVLLRPRASRSRRRSALPRSMEWA